MTNALLATTTTTSAMTSTTTGTIGDEANRLVKAMEEMSIHSSEMNKLKEKLTILETNCKLAQIMHKEEQQKATRMNERVKSLEKELMLSEPLGKAKQLLWANTIDSINDIWPSI